MKYYMDTEFYECAPCDVRSTDPIPGANSIQLISIGIVAEDGREFYAENRDFDWRRVPRDHWLQDNVRPYLWGDPRPFLPEEPHPWKSFWHDPANHGGFWDPDTIAKQIQYFVDPGQNRNRDQFYGWYCDYDWVVFCGLFGRMIDLPAGFPMYMRDLKQTADMLGVSDLPNTHPSNDLPEHHALADARGIQIRHRVLQATWETMVKL